MEKGLLNFTAFQLTVINLKHYIMKNLYFVVAVVEPASHLKDMNLVCDCHTATAMWKSLLTCLKLSA
jgi:hypothetical protein